MSLAGSLRGVQANPEPCNSDSNSKPPHPWCMHCTCRPAHYVLCCYVSVCQLSPLNTHTYPSVGVLHPLADECMSVVLTHGPRAAQLVGGVRPPFRLDIQTGTTIVTTDPYSMPAVLLLFCASNEAACVRTPTPYVRVRYAMLA
jgi:hypothetical protein